MHSIIAKRLLLTQDGVGEFQPTAGVEFRSVDAL